MRWNLLLFDVLPYVALALAIAGTIWRWRTRPFTISSLSSLPSLRTKAFQPGKKLSVSTSQLVEVEVEVEAEVEVEVETSTSTKTSLAL